MDLRLDTGLFGFMGTVAVCRVTEDEQNRSRYGVVCRDPFQQDEMRKFLKRLKQVVQFMALSPNA